MPDPKESAYDKPYRVGPVGHEKTSRANANRERQRRQEKAAKKAPKKKTTTVTTR